MAPDLAAQGASTQEDATMEETFKIVLTKNIPISNSTLIVGFPGVGLISTIAANFIVDSLKMENVGYMRSEKLPPAAVVQEGIPMAPVRIFMRENLAILLSDFPIPIQIANMMAQTILDWKDSNGRFKSIITLEGLMAEPTQEIKEIKVFGVGSTVESRERLKKAKINTFDHGWITGVSGLLLSDGSQAGQEVICLLADANAMYPDARSAAKLVESVDILLPEIKLDLKPLYDEAEKIEGNIKEQIEKAKQIVSARQGPAGGMSKSYMYG
jgi:uncharacterized protein